MKITHNYTGASLLELKQKYPNHFYDQSWYEKEDFAKECAENGMYEITFDRNTCSKTYSEQIDCIPKGNIVPSASVVIEAIIEHFEKTGQRLLEDWWVRTSNLDSDGHHVYVGCFDSKGLRVNGWHDDRRNDVIGLASARKLDIGSIESLDTPLSLKLDILPKEISINNVIYVRKD